MSDIEFHKLPEENQNRIISAGIEMMAALTDAFGAKRGEELWDVIGDAIGKDVKYGIFTAMLTGQHNINTVSIKGPVYYAHGWAGTIKQPNGANKVAFIKAIRKFSGMGLREAKEFSENLNDSRVYYIKGNNPEYNRADFIRDCKENDITAF